jgi:hypothetical protein
MLPIYAALQACNPLAPDAPDLTQFPSVDAWLGSLKMGRYSDNFAAAGVVTMDQVARLGLNQLVELGITLVGHQKKINNSIQVGGYSLTLFINIYPGYPGPAECERKRRLPSVRGEGDQSYVSLAGGGMFVGSHHRQKLTETTISGSNWRSGR